MLRYPGISPKLPNFLRSLAPGVILPRTASPSPASNPRIPSVGSVNYSSDARPYSAFPLQSSDPSILFKDLNERLSHLHRGEPIPSDPQVEVFNATVVRLRHALKIDKDIHAAWEQWSILEERKLLHFLGQPQLEIYSNLIAALCPLDTPRSPWDEMERKAIEEIALVTAAGGAPEALNACMMVHLKRGASNVVLELYDRFLQLTDGKDASKELQRHEEGDSQVDELAPISTEQTTRQSSGVVSTLLAVIAAHTMQNAFGAAFEASSQMNIRHHHWTTTDFLKQFNYDPTLKQKVEIYIRRLEIARLLERPGSLSRQIFNLARDHAIIALEKLYNMVLAGLHSPDAYLANHLSSVNFNKPVSVPETFWTSFLTAFIRCRRFDLAHKLWDDMSTARVHPGTAVWTALFTGYDSIGAVDETLTAWESMFSQEVEPDGLTYRACISALFNGKRPDEAMEKFKAFQRQQSKRSPPLEDDHILVVYNTVIHGLLTISKDEAAASVMETMLDTGPKPDLITYNTFLQCHARRGNFKAIASTLQDLTSNGYHGDVFTFSTILSALLRVGREDAIDATLKLMDKHGVKPNVATYSAIIDHLVRERDEKSLRGALSLLRKMEGMSNAKPNEVTYTAILAGIYRGTWLDRQVVEECTQYIWASIKQRKIQPSRATYNVILKACLQNRDPEGR